ncbi:MAG: T9SS type A sorting domain-containing protein, partial [Flavobacteriales bacterium]
GESFIGLKRPFGAPSPTSETAALVSVDPLTGALTNIVELPQIYAFSPNASVFEQTTGLFIMLYYDFNNQSHIIVVDPAEGEIVADHEIDGSFIELQINNREFMVAAYGNANDIVEASPTPTVTAWPNPATTEVNIQHVDVPYRIYDEAGRLMRNLSHNARVNTTLWPAGTYIISLANGVSTRFTVVR